MPEYSQTVQFEREFRITAKNAKEANDKLGDLIRQAEWDASIENQGYYDFEDEPVECPECKGRGEVGEDEKECPKCKGECSIPFEG